MRMYIILMCLNGVCNPVKELDELRFYTMQDCIRYSVYWQKTTKDKIQALHPSANMLVDIKSQPLADALTDWAQQTGYQVVVPMSKEAERITKSIKGKMTALESLDLLLVGSGLVFELINTRTVAIHENFSVFSCESLFVITIDGVY